MACLSELRQKNIKAPRGTTLRGGFRKHANSFVGGFTEKSVHKGLPLKPETNPTASDAILGLKRMGAISKANGNSEMSLEDINREIEAARNERKNALLKKDEDEHDAAIFQDAYDEYAKSGKQSRPIDKLWSECDLT